MSEKTTLLDWFSIRRESVVSKQMRNHAQKVGDTITEFNRAMSALCQGDKGQALDALKRSFLSEKEADTIEESVAHELSRGDMDSKHREDLMHLIRRMDYAADWCKEAGMNLQLLLEIEAEIPKNVWTRFCIMTKELEKMSRNLKICADNFGVNNDVVLKHHALIEESEHTMDEMYFSQKKEFFLSEVDCRSLYILRDLLHGIENSADKFKDTADMFAILTISEKDRSR